MNIKTWYWQTSKSLLATLFAAASVTTTSRAANLAWDTPTLTSGAQGGTGAWHGQSQGRRFWWDGLTNVAWSDGSFATFGPNAGTITVDSAVSASGLTFSTNGYTISGSSILTLSGGNIIQVTNVSDTATIIAPIGGSAGLEKNGDGTLTIAATSSLTGGVTIDSGMLKLNSSGVLSSAGNIQIAAAAGLSATLTLDGGAHITQSGASTLEVGNGTSGAAVLNISATSGVATFDTGTGQMTISKTGTVNIGNVAGGSFGTTLNANGNVTIDGGILSRNGGSAFNLATGKTMTIQNGGLASFTFANDYTTANAAYNITGSGSKIEASSALNIGAGSQVNVSSGAALLSGNFMDVGANASLTVEGAGSSVTAKNQSTWGVGGAANVTFSNGATGDLQGEVDMALGSVPNSAATLNVQSGANFGVGILKLATDDSTGLSATININGVGSLLSQSFSGVLGGTITVGNSGSSPAAINIGTTANGGTFTTNTGPVTINKTGSVTVGNGTNTGTLNIGGQILVNAGGSLTVNSGSVATISGAYFGTAIGGAGQVNFQSSINPGFGIGNAANATFGGNVALASTAGLNIEIGGTTPGTQFDHVNVNGQLAVNGTLAVSFVNGFAPAAGNTFDILDWGSLSGRFSSIQLPALPTGLGWNLTQLYSTGVVSVTMPPGDFNTSAHTDAADYVLWRKSDGLHTTYDTWRANFGANKRALGVDVSHFQGNTGVSQDAWNQLAAEGKRFAFIKATEGLTGPDDSTMATNVARATSAGILNGVYHFAHPENRPTPAGAVLEADHFLSFAGAAIGPGHLRPVLDIEGNSSQLTASALTDWVIAFSNEVIAVRGASAAPIIYTTSFFTNSKFDSRIASYDLWLAVQSSLNDPQTGDPGTINLGQFSNWSFWQYVVGTAGGISSIDLDVVHSEYKPLTSFVIPTPVSASQLVPEPAAAALLLMFAAICAFSRRVARIGWRAPNFFLLLLIAILSARPHSAIAATKDWKFNAGGSWSAAGNWNPSGMPGAGDVVNVTGFLFNPVTVTYDYAGSDVTLNSLTLDAISAATLTFNMPGGNLIANDEYVAYGGAGQTQATVATIDVSGGVNTINNNLFVGYNSNDSGLYILRSNAQIFATNNTTQNIGYNGTGEFTQYGTSINHPHSLILATNSGSHGTYTLGVLPGDNATIAAASEYIGYGGSATFTQNSGTNTITGGNLHIAELASSTGVYNLNGGAFSALNQFIGVTGNGTLHQTGGTNTLAYLLLGQFSGSTGTYRLDGGSLTFIAAGILSVGSASTGNFIQSGGTAQLNNSPLFVGENSFGTGAYTMTGGSLTAASEYVGHFGTGALTQSAGFNTIAAGGSLLVGNGDVSKGSYTLSGTGTLTVNGNEYIGEHATGDATQSGGTFTQTGGAHTIIGTNSALYIGMNGGSTGTYNLSGPFTTALQVDGNEYIGHSSAGGFNRTGGTFNQSGGAQRIIGSNHALIIGNNAGATGTYNFSSGNLIVDGDETIGFNGTGTFNQTGGSHFPNLQFTTGMALYLGRNVGSTGNYNLMVDGIGGLDVGDGSRANVYIGYSGTGNFHHIRGSHFAGNSGLVALGYNVGAVGTYTLENGSLYTGDLRIGYHGTGHFDISGGGATTNSSGIFVGDQSDGMGTISISGTGVLFSSNNAYLGYNGRATVTQTGGELTVRGGLSMADQVGSNSDYTLSGTGKIKVGNPNQPSGIITLGKAGTAVLTQSGGTVTADALFIAPNINGSGTYTLSGGSLTLSGPQLGINGGVQLGKNSGVASLIVSGTGVLTSSAGISIDIDAFGNGVTLSGGTINAGHLFFPNGPFQGSFNWTGGTLNVTNSVNWDVNGPPDTSDALYDGVTIDANKTFLITGNETLGLADQSIAGGFTISLDSGGTHSVSGDIAINPRGTLTRNVGSTLTYGGTFTMQGGTFNGVLENLHAFQYNSGAFNGRLINQGTVGVTGNFAPTNGVENDTTITLSAGQTLTANGAGLDNKGTFNLSGGTLAGAGPLLSSGYFFFNAGTISATSGFTNQAGGQFIVPTNVLGTVNGAMTNAGELQLGGLATTLSGTGMLTNTGVVRGDGLISKTVANNAGGEIRAESGKRLKFIGSVSPNAGRINLLGGIAEFSGALTNGSTGQVLGGGTLVTSGAGLTNNGQLLLSGGTSYFFGDVNNNTGTSAKGITITGNSSATFWDDVTNTGPSLFKVTTGSSATFFGTYGGTGTTGGGDLHFEGDITPGASPATVTFANHVVFGAGAVAKFELAGTSAGTQYDQIHVNGLLDLDGALQVSFINGFTPTAGHSFDLLDWTTLSGTFSSLVLPSSGGLTWDTSQLYTTGVLTVASSGTAGDYNSNGTVDAADYILWRKNQGSTNVLPNDPTGGTIGTTQYNTWRTHFGQPPGTGSGLTSASTSQVPEPASGVLLLLACFLMANCIWKDASR